MEQDKRLQNEYTKLCDSSVYTNNFNDEEINFKYYEETSCPKTKTHWRDAGL